MRRLALFGVCALLGCGRDLPRLAPARGPIAIVTPTLPAGRVGQAYQAEIVAAGEGAEVAQWRHLSGRLPAGLALQFAAGPRLLVRGTPTEGGTTTIQVGVIGAGRSDDARFQITVDGPPSSLIIATGALATPTLFYEYRQAILVEGGVPPYTIELASGVLPPGLRLDTSDGFVITGIPGALGTFELRLRAHDATRAIAERDYRVTVVAESSALRIRTSALPRAYVGLELSAVIEAVGGSNAGYVWRALDPLPDGLVLDPTGTPGTVLHGRPTIAQTARLPIQVEDSSGETASMTLVLIVLPSALTIVTEALPDAEVDRPYHADLEATGGAGAHSWRIIVGQLPAGLALNASEEPRTSISGLPVTPGSYRVTIQVSDSIGAIATRDLSLEVPAPPPRLSLLAATLPDARVAEPYTQWIIASGGHPPYTFSAPAGQLPAGLTLSGAGVLRTELLGIPELMGTYHFTIEVADASGDRASALFSLVVRPAPQDLAIVPSTSTTAALAACSGYGLVLHGVGGSESGYRFSVDGALPPGVSLDDGDPDAVLRGFVTTPGAYAFTIVLEDDQAGVADLDLFVEVGPGDHRLTLIGDPIGRQAIQAVPACGPAPGTPTLVASSSIGVSSLVAAGPGLAYLVDVLPSGRGRLEVALDGFTSMTLVEDSVGDFELSPDGAQLAFRGDRDGTLGDELWLVDLALLGPPRAVSPPFTTGRNVQAGGYHFGPLGELAYIADQDLAGLAELYFVDVAGVQKISGAFPLGATGVVTFAFDPGGRGLYYVGDQATAGRRGLWWVGRNASGFDAPVRIDEVLAGAGGVRASTVRFSPTGSDLAYLADQRQGGVFELFYAPAVGAAYGPSRRMSAPMPPSSDVGAYAWSPEGGRLVYRADPTPGVDELFSVALAPNATPQRVSPTMIAGGDVGAFSLALGPQGTELAFLGDATVDDVVELWLLRPSSASPTRISPVANVPGMDVTDLWFGPGAKNLVFRAKLSGSGRAELYGVALGQGGVAPPVMLHALPTPGGQVSGVVADVQFRSDGSAVYFRGDLSINGQADVWMTSLMPFPDDQATRFHPPSAPPGDYTGFLAHP